MQFKTVLGDLEWKIFFLTYTWWATFYNVLAVIFVRKTHESFLKSKSNPGVGEEKHSVLVPTDLCKKNLSDKQLSVFDGERFAFPGTESYDERSMLPVCSFIDYQ